MKWLVTRVMHRIFTGLKLSNNNKKIKVMRNVGEIRLEMVVQSHLNDLPYDSEDVFNTRLKYVKTIIFHNPNLNVEVTLKYLQWLWKEVENDRHGSSFDEFENS